MIRDVTQGLVGLRAFSHRHTGRGRRTLFLAGVPVVVAGSLLAITPQATLAAAAAAAPPAAASGHLSVSGLSGVRAVPVPDASADVFWLENANATDKCLGIDSSGDAGDWTCTTKNDQAWRLGDNYDDSAYNMLVNEKGQCLGVAGASMAEGAQVVGYTCLPSHPDQYWDIAYEGSVDGYGEYTVEDLHSRLVLGVAGGSTANGAPVVQWKYNAFNQLWLEGSN